MSQGGVIHFEKVVKITPVITVDLNPSQYGDITTQGLSENLHYELISNYKIANMLHKYEEAETNNTY